ncbi:MAG: ester cyclase [Burkholderiales bacterium]|nr:ester cyclase [Burkholderiales bacterium]
MSTRLSSIDIVSRCVQGFSSQQLGQLDNCFKPDYARYVTPGVPGVRSYSEHLAELRNRHSKLSSARFDMHEIFGDENTVIARFVLSAQHTGDFLGIPATGRAFIRPQICFFHFKDMQIADNYSFVDMQLMLDCLRGQRSDTEHWPRVPIAQGKADPLLPAVQAKKVSALLEHAFNAGGPVHEDALHEDFRAYGLPGAAAPLTGPEYLAFLRSRRDRYRAASMSIDEMYAHAAGVAVRYTVRGESAATAVRAPIIVSEQCATIFHFADERMVNAFAILDSYGVQVQLDAGQAP